MKIKPKDTATTFDVAENTITIDLNEKAGILKFELMLKWMSMNEEEKEAEILKHFFKNRAEILRFSAEVKESIDSQKLSDDLRHLFSTHTNPKVIH